jgi:hypothetical protein
MKPTPIYDKPGEPAMYLVTDSEASGSDSELNLLLPNAEPGTMITTAGFGVIKQKAEDGSWATFGG